VAAAVRVLEGVDIVVHAAAALPLSRPRDIYTADVEETGTVFEVTRRQGIERVVHISSTVVYGIPDHPARRDEPPRRRRPLWPGQDPGRDDRA